MDLDMPILDGIEAIRIATATYPQINLLYSLYLKTERIFEAIKAGANGYLLKDDKAVNIVDAIINVYEHNGVPMSPSIARKAMELMLGNNPSSNKDSANAGELGLTNREIEILKELSSGASYNVIGEKLFISPLTVRKHVTNLIRKNYMLAHVLK
ncbi:MAG: response regulator transcription factor [Bacteroidetes bacterium]|nr:response regulator transcription factor [Bacteroidota bacterium]